MGGSPAESEFSPSWIEERWRTLPSAADDGNTRLGDRTFAWIRGRGSTPALISVTLPTLGHERVGPDGLTRTSALKDFDHHWEQTRTGLPRLRSLLPDDCFPFSVMARGGSFATGHASSLPELEALGERLLADLERLPRRRPIPKGLVQIGPRVEICLADDGSDYRRAGIINVMGAPPTDGGAPLIVARARHRGVHNTALGSADRLVELDLPRLRAERPGGEISLLGLVPDGACWGNIRRHHGMGHVCWDISHGVRRWGAERGVNACELVRGDRLPLGLPLPLPHGDAERESEELAEYLSGRSYDDGDYERGIVQLLAEPGELKFRKASLPVLPESDGRSELAELRRLLEDG